jgi:hypothetical protein
VALGDDLCVKCWDNGARVRPNRREIG